MNEQEEEDLQVALDMIENMNDKLDEVLKMDQAGVSGSTDKQGE